MWKYGHLKLHLVGATQFQTMVFINNVCETNTPAKCGCNLPAIGREVALRLRDM